MKRTIFLILSICWFSNTLWGQSKTIEISPEFQLRNSINISNPINISADLSELSFVGLSGYHFGEGYTKIQFRLLQNDKWSDWIPLAKQHEVEIGVRKVYEAPFIKKSFNKIQFRSQERLQTAFNVRFFFGGKSNSELIPKLRSLNCDKPTICERVCWCPNCPIDNTPEFTDPTHLIVHHSAGSNQSTDFKSVVEYIWDLHVNTNGWDDIGYNWLVDPDGVLYEGRPDNYQGAHFSCLNENTIGICMIGDYSLIQPSPESIDILVNLIAYESTQHLIDVTGESYHLTGEFNLNNVAGHRDSSASINSCSATACPGDSFYPMLDSIRFLVSELPCYKGVSSVTENNSIEVLFYPNPFSENIFIHSRTDNIDMVELINIKGESVATIKTQQINELGHLPNGLYFALYKGRVLNKILKHSF